MKTPEDKIIGMIDNILYLIIFTIGVQVGHLLTKWELLQ